MVRRGGSGAGAVVVSRRGLIGAAGVPVAGGALVALAGAGCAPAGGSTAGEAGRTPAVTPATVRVHARAGSEDEAYTRRLAEFSAQNKRGITAVYEGLLDYYTKLVNLIASGTVGDLVYVHHTNLAYQQYANGGLLLPVDDLIARDRLDLTPWFPPTRQGMEYEGKWWGLPIRGQIVWNTLFYNPVLVEGAGLPDPAGWSHADLLPHLQRLTRRGGAGGEPESYGAMPGGWGDFSYTVSLLRRFGAELMSRDGKQVTVNSPAAQAALQWYADAWHRSRILKSPLRPPGEGTYDALGNGTAATMISAQGGFRADIHKAINGAYRLEFRVMPKGPTGRVGGFLALNTNSIVRSSAQPGASWEVLKWLSDRETSYALATQQTGSNTPNFRKDSYCDERLLADPRFSRPSMSAICAGAELPEPDALIWNLRYDDLNRVLGTRMNELRDNKAEPNAGWLGALRAELQAVADLPRDTGLGGGR